MKKIIFVTSLFLIFSISLVSDSLENQYLDCGKPTQNIDRQFLLLKVFPNKTVATLDKNLQWVEENPTSVNLDEYVFESDIGIYELKRDTLELLLISNGEIHSTFCSISSKEKLENEIQSIIERKVLNQKI